MERAIESFGKHILTQTEEEVADRLNKFNTPNYSGITMQQLELQQALSHPLWQNHNRGCKYTMDNKPELWKIVYYPIFENGKTGELYAEPRALMETPMPWGIDFREVPLRYLTPWNKQ